MKWCPHAHHRMIPVLGDHLAVGFIDSGRLICEGRAIDVTRLIANGGKRIPFISTTVCG